MEEKQDMIYQIYFSPTGGTKRKLFISRKIITQNHAAVLYYNISGLRLRKMETKVERK